MSFVRKNRILEAYQFLNDESSYALLEWINQGQFNIGKPFATWHNNTLTIPKLSTDLIALKWDWIIRDVSGEHYSCKPDVFDKTYEIVDMERENKNER